jgi:HlyD family secretion protein
MTSPIQQPVPQTPQEPKAAGSGGQKSLARHTGWKWLGLAACGIAVLGWFFGGPLLLGPVITASPILRADLVQTIVASGHIETPFRVSVSSQITGVVAAIPVAEGQKVGVGETLIRLDDSEARASVVLVEGQMAQAEARVRQVRDLTLPAAEQNLTEARATLVNVQQIYARVSKLLADGISTRVAFDEATKNLDIARAHVRNAELTVFSNRPGGADFAVAETQLAQASATLRAAQTRLGYTEIKAARDGVLIWREVEVGNVVQPGKELMRLSPAGEMQIAIQIDEKNLGLIALNQKALASADAFSKETFPATVTFINPGIDLQRASVEVKLTVASPPDYLRQDMTVSVDIEVERRAKAIIVSVADIKELSAGKPWLLKVENSRAIRQPITVGMISAGKAEVLTGLDVGVVVVPAASKIKDGQRVRVRAPIIAQP